jgi:hypothetical protein
VINILTNKFNSMGNAVREFNEANLPTEHVPDTETGEHAVLGKDANLPLIVKELAPLQLDSIHKEREKLQKRLQEIDQYEATLRQLLAVVTPHAGEVKWNM